MLLLCLLKWSGKALDNIAGFDRLVQRRKDNKLSTRMQHREVINKDRSVTRQRELIKQKLFKIKKAEAELAAKGINFSCITLVD
jgi:hypothetical protein